MKPTHAILTYHSIDDSGSIISVAPAIFRAQMEFLAGCPAAVVTVAELIAGSHASAVAITFDDAFANFATEALPVLKDLDLQATVYVPTGRVGGTNDWDPGDSRIPTLPLMNWDTISNVAGDGVALGSHTASHVHLTDLSETVVLEELTVSAKAIEEKCGTRPSSLAYPYGSFDSRVARCVADAGYANAVTTDFDYIRSAGDPYRLPRLDAYYFRNSRTLQNWGSRGFASYVRLRRLGRTVKALVRGRP